MSKSSKSIISVRFCEQKTLEISIYVWIYLTSCWKSCSDWSSRKKVHPFCTVSIRFGVEKFALSDGVLHSAPSPWKKKNQWGELLSKTCRRLHYVVQSPLKPGFGRFWKALWKLENDVPRTPTHQRLVLGRFRAEKHDFLVSSQQKAWISTNSNRKIPRLIVIWSEWQPISCSLPTVLSFGSLSDEFCFQSFRKYTQNLISSAREWKETVTKAIEKSLQNHCPRLQIVRNHQSVSGYAIWGPNIRPNCSFQNLPKPGFKILRYSCRFWPKVHLIKFSFFLEIQQNGVPHRIERIFLPRIQLKKWEIDELFFECFSHYIVAYSINHF